MSHIALSTSPRAPDDGHIALGKRLKAARLAANLSQGELGEMLGVTFQQIQKYEKGANRMDVQRVIKAAKLMKVPANTLMGLNGKGEANEELTEIDDMMATREGVQVIRAMVKLNIMERKFLVEVARRLPRLRDGTDESDDE